MRARPFIDTNVLVYFFFADDARRTRAEELLSEGALISVQVLNEFASVARTKMHLSWERFRQLREQIMLVVPEPLPLTLQTHMRAVETASRYGFTIYDGLILAAALDAGSPVLYTEDLQHGQVIDGLRIENPFVNPGAP
jgi:predicted nucleic acid-binding protein